MLPFSVFEKYMWLEDRVDYPMVFRICLRFQQEPSATASPAAAMETGHISLERLERAVLQALKQHPLLRCTVESGSLPGHRRGPVWKPSASPPARVTAVNVLPETIEPIDLSQQTGLRVRYCRAERTLLFDFHHCCCDGLGAVSVIAEIAKQYGASPGDASAPALVHLDSVRISPSTMKRIGRLIIRLPQEVIGTLALLEYFPNHPISLRRPHSASKQGIGCHSETLDAKSFADVRRTLKKAQRTVNDHYIASVIQGISDWQGEVDGKQPQAGHLRLLIPMNMRTSEHRTNESANIVSMVYLDRRPWKWKSGQAGFDQLRRWMRIEMQLIKRMRMGHTFLRLMEFCDRSRIGIAALLPEDRCLATSVATNLGQPFKAIAPHNLSLSDHRTGPSGSDDERLRFGDAVVDHVSVCPPVRPKTSATFGVVSYQSRFTLNMTWSQQEISSEAAQLLFRKVAERFSPDFAP